MLSFTQTKKIRSPIGDLWVSASDKGVCRLSNRAPKAGAGKNVSAQAERLLKKAEAQIHEYFAGKRREFDLPLDLEGTVFQLKVWRTIGATPFAWTISYKDLARKAGNADAIRAAAAACGANPVLLLVPCHRIVASDGGLGGFSAGLRVKKWLLAMEEASCTMLSLRASCPRTEPRSRLARPADRA